jgi:hypothetical protein
MMLPCRIVYRTCVKGRESESLRSAEFERVLVSEFEKERDRGNSTSRFCPTVVMEPFAYSNAYGELSTYPLFVVDYNGDGTPAQSLRAVQEEA